jgi:hypothetical protein
MEALGGLRLARLDGSDHDVDAHDHSASASVRGVVHAAMTSDAKVPQIAEMNGRAPFGESSTHEPDLQKSLESLWKQRDHVEAHCELRILSTLDALQRREGYDIA